jgi:pyruvate dehydrogenase E1 component
MNQALIPFDTDPLETQEWRESLEAVMQAGGRPRAHYLIDQLSELDAQQHGDLHTRAWTAYVNTIPPERQPAYPGDLAIERRLNAMIRWNAMVMVLRAGKHSNVGGHIATYQSAAVLYDVGFDHFFRGRTDTFDGDMIYIQGHSAPGIYGRAYVEGRIDPARMDNFRREAGREGLSSYPHPRLMPEFWQFPTVSMGLGPLTAAYQARYMRYLEYRGLKEHQGRKVWAFLGDGEMDQPESLAAISGRPRAAGQHRVRGQLQPAAPGRSGTRQRQGHPGTGRHLPRGRLERDQADLGQWLGRPAGPRPQRPAAPAHDGMRGRRLPDLQVAERRLRARAFLRPLPELLELVAHMSDDDIWALARGGHDPQKVYAAYQQAVNTSGRPTVILAKTVKGFGMGEAGEGQNINHQLKKMSADAVRAFRDRFNLPVSDDQLEEMPYLRPEPGSAEAPTSPSAAASRAAAAGAPGQGRSAAAAAAVDLQHPAAGQRRSRPVHHHGLRAHPHQPAEGPGTGQAGDSDRAR